MKTLPCMENPSPVRRRVLTALLVAGVSCSCSTAWAGLYPKAAPPGSAYLRVFNASSTTASAQVGGQTIQDIGPYDGSGFIFMPGGNYSLKIGGNSQNVNLESDRYYTAVSEPTGIHVFEQGRFDSQLKALVSVFNLADGNALSLRTADGKVTVIDAISTNSVGQREVNSAKVTLALFDGTSKIVEAKPIAIERGQTYSLFVTGTASPPMVSWLLK